MTSQCLFLLLYLLGSFFGGSSAQRNETCDPRGACGLGPDSTSHFLQCVGLSSADTGKDHMRRMKGMLEATMDVYTFMRSSMTGVPILSLEGALDLSLEPDPLQNEDLVHMWLEVRMKPLLKSITKHFLSCLSTKNFSCSTYQIVVKELSHHYSEMLPVRQKWIYTFFMYPFLSGDRVAGCVNPEESSEEWLMKNFGAFTAMARMKDFSTLNMVFSDLEVLHLLSPAQKAELLLRPEVAGLDNGTLALVFHNLLTGGHGPPPTGHPGGGHNWTGPGYPSIIPPYRPQPPSPQDSLREVVKGFMTAFKPIGSFVHDFVSFTQERDVSEIRSTTLTQFLMNWTLAELADMYRPQSTSVVPQTPRFDVSNVEDWYMHVVVPVLKRLLVKDADMMHPQIKHAFHQLFFLDHGLNNESSEVLDVCSITLDKSPCGLTDAVKNVAHVLHCAARTNLTMTEETIMRLITELTKRLNSLIKELSRANFKELASDFQEIFSEAESPSLTQEHLEDPEFIKLWFQIKLLPLLPDVQPDLLLCLSTKNFSCPVYQTIVAALSKHISVMDADPMYSHNIYENFIYSFLLHHNSSDPQCVSSANQSAEWLEKNFDFFSRFASITDFYRLNPHFSGLEVLHLLSPRQIAEMLLLPLPPPPEKDVVINHVFDFLIESPGDRRFPEVLNFVVLLAEEVNPPCDVYRQIFERLYGAISSVSPDLEPVVWAHIDDLINIAPEECVPENITCPVTQFNGDNICRGINSSDQQSYLNTSMHVSCNFTLEKYACAQLENFTANQLVSLLKCDLPGNSSHSKVLWKMLLTKLSFVLDPALDILANMSMGMVGPSAMEVLDVIGEIRVSLLTDEELMNSSVINTWFSRRLSGFLPSASGRFLQCLSNRNISCQSYQQILKVFIHQFKDMTLKQQHVVLKDFILHFLRQPHSGPGCVSASNSSAEWLKKNLGPFSGFLSLKELLHLNPYFNPLEVLRLLSPNQSAELLVLNLPTLPDKDVIINLLFDHLTESSEMGKLPEFLSHLSVVLQQANLSCSSYRTLFTRLDMAMATVSLDVASSITYSKMDLSKYIPPGCIIYSGECNVTITNETDICVGVNSTELQLHLDSRKMSGRFCNFAVEEFACASLSGLKAEDLAEMLKCNRTFNSSGSRAVWKLLLSKTSHVLDEALDLLSNMTLDPSNPAVSMVLDSIREIRLDTIDMANLNDPALIQLWFNRRLRPFLPAVSPEFLSCLATRGLNCSTYQHIVQILSRLRPHMMLSRQMSVYTHFIKSYLTRNNTAATKPRCYNPSDPQLNSTAWFVEYVGSFVLFLTLEDLQTFGSEEEIQKFTVNPLNIALFNHSALPLNLTNYYTQLIYQQDSNFHPLLLPVLWLCVVPGSAFSQLTVEESRTVLYNLTTLCTDLDPQVSAALAGNFGENIDATVISALGNESTGLSTGQIKTIKPEDLLGALSTLSSVIGWNEGQAKAIVQVLSGIVKINSSSSLVMLGSLVVGVPANVFGSIDGSELITASKIPSFLTNIMTAPQIVQQTFVTQIISVNTNSESIIQNVPDELANEIPRVLLLGLSSNTVVIERLNKKKWKQQQVELFFSVIAVETATAQLGGLNNLSSSVLQGFTCTAVRTIQTVQIKKLVKACRRKGRNRVTLVETQLTCMYNYIKGDPDATVFSLYPTNVLLYYDYSLVPPASCRSYFKELADADFSVFSSALSYKRSALFDNARSCLGITNTSLTEDNVEVLGNMCCTLDGSYIQNSHQSILEKLKGCSDISDTQTAAVETLLISGNTRYGAPSTWNQQTLRDLDMLPLYLTRTFYGFFNKKTKRRFLRYFLKVLRGNKVERQKRRKMRREIRRSSNKKLKPSIVTECTAGNITQVTIRDDTFPFDYDDINQFDCCLSATTVRDNLGAITEKVDQEDYLEIVLKKLREAYNSTIPEDQVQVLAAASREATTEDINMWTITQIDTLAALMDSSNGPWDPSLAKAIISKYLSYKGNKLGSAELNVIGGENLCSLDADVLKTISTQSLKETNVLDVSNCTTEKKRELFTIARQTFNGVAHSVTISTPSYLLTKPYVGGATLDYVQSLAASNISMDLPTFTSLDQLVILNLTVNEVRGLLGTNLPDLKSYENETVVQNWVSRQFQSDVETLGVGLSGGRADPTTPTNSPTNSTINATTPSGSVTTPSGSNTTKPSGSVTTPSGSNTTKPSGSVTTPSDSNTTKPSGSFTTPSDSNTTKPSGSVTTPSDSNTTKPSGSVTTPSGSNTTKPSGSVTTPSGSNTTKPSGSFTTPSGSNTTKPSGSFTTPSGSNTTKPSGSVTTPSGSNTTKPSGSFTTPSGSNTTKPSGSFTTPSGSNTTKPSGSVTTPSDSNTTKPSGSVTTPSDSNTTKPSGSVTTPSDSNTTKPSGSVTTPSDSNTTKPSGSVTTPSDSNTTKPSGSVTTPSDSNTTKPSGSVTTPSDSNTTKPSGSVTTPSDSNTTKPSGSVTTPSGSNTTKPSGSITTPSDSNTTKPSGPVIIPSGSVTTPSTSSSTLTAVSGSSSSTASNSATAGCIICNGKCNVTITNETDICVGVNSTELQLHLDSRKMSGRFCNFAVEEFACASLSGLKAEDLAEMLKCNRTFNSSGSRAVWKLLLSKTSHVLDEALDLLSNMTLDPSNPAVSMVLDSIREIRLDTIDMANLNDPALIQLWFNRRLRPFLPAVSPEFLSCLATRGLNCSTYQHILQILSRLRPHMMLSRQMSVYTHFIKSYLTRNNTAATKPRCYNPSDPQLNSTAWFVEYVGSFVLFLTLEDLQTFGSEEEIQKFTVNPLNIALFNHSALPLNLTNYYTQLIYQQDSNFHPLLLPVLWLCVVPGSAFSQLTVEESRTVLYNLTTLCTDLDPQVSAALAGNFGENIDATVISALGNESTGLSTGQIKTIKPEDLLGALSTLSSVIGWNEGQAKAIVQVLSGIVKINSSSSLVMLGSLVVGVPANVFGSIDGSELITASKIPSFLTNIMTAPQIVQQTFVTQIISVNTNSESIIQNVPDELATEIPRVLLLGLSSNTVVIERLNKKKWKQQQVELFFSVIAVETATAQLGGLNNLSSSVLQGFTCTAVRTIQTVQIKKLVKACRRKGRNRVTLVETQLTCMYNYIKGDPDATVFSLYPTNVLLYYDYSLVPPASCRSYFKELADADFSVFSSALSYKRSALFDNARSCLGITNTSLTEDNVEVLGNMCCTLDGSYIQNSDQSILEKLKGCSDISDTQTAAVETLLISGNTRYGAPSTWNQQTLRDLDMLPLYLTRTFYGFFNKKTKRRFLRYFLKVLRGNKVERQKRRKMRREIRRSSNKKSKRSIVTECTAGNITQVTIRDDTFPFDYDDINQFDCCLSATTVRDNLGAITEKVDQEDYLEIVLKKLREAYNSTIPEDQVQVLAAASREATTEDINMWTITQIDTLAALMDSSNGPWDPSLAKAIISKYLSYKGNKLGSAELNVIGGANLCSLDADVLKTISTQSLKETNVVDVSNCTTEKKRELFTIARQAFNGVARSVTISTPSYLLTKPYVGGATLDYVQSLAASNISMDLPTFTSLDQLVILNLTVNEVRGLLGTNLPDLKSYENETVVQNWVSRQFQSDVETLGVGLSGGRADPTTPSISSSTPSAGSGSSSSTASNSATTGNGSRIRADTGFSLLVLLALLITSQQAMM